MPGLGVLLGEPFRVKSLRFGPQGRIPVDQVWHHSDLGLGTAAQQPMGQYQTTKSTRVEEFLTYALGNEVRADVIVLQGATHESGLRRVETHGLRTCTVSGLLLLSMSLVAEVYLGEDHVQVLQLGEVVGGRDRALAHHLNQLLHQLVLHLPVLRQQVKRPRQRDARGLVTGKLYRDTVSTTPTLPA